VLCERRAQYRAQINLAIFMSVLGTGFIGSYATSWQMFGVSL